MRSLLNRPPGPFLAGSRYNAYGPFLKEKFGCRVYKVSVDAGFTCPNRDGQIARGGCTFCNNDSFRPDSMGHPASVQEQIKSGIAYLKRRYRAKKFIVYFQPFSNTYAPIEDLIPLYSSALEHEDVIGISVGTRPDCIDEEKIAWLERLARKTSVTLEYGLESIYDRTLERINRGHNFQSWLDAVERTRNRGIWLGAHLILGFPWETIPEMLATADAVSSVGLDFLKLHHLQVVRETPMAREYAGRPFPLLDYDQYLDLVVRFLERLNPNIRLERLFSLAPEDHVLGPRWGKTKAEVQYGIESRLAERDTHQGRLHVPITGSDSQCSSRESSGPA
jgi:radical SAM protein (TIGR01212 family)